MSFKFYQKFDKIIFNIKIILIANPCWKSKCSNSGTCDYNTTFNNFTCNCFNGYNGTLCQNCKYFISIFKFYVIYYSNYYFNDNK